MRMDGPLPMASLDEAVRIDKGAATKARDEVGSLVGVSGRTGTNPTGLIPAWCLLDRVKMANSACSARRFVHRRR